MSPATNHMSIMDPQKSDNGEFQQFQFVGSVPDTQNCISNCHAFCMMNCAKSNRLFLGNEDERRANSQNESGYTSHVLYGSTKV